MNIIFWLAVIATIFAIGFTALIYGANKWSLHNSIDPNADWFLIGVWILIMVLWALWIALK